MTDETKEWIDEYCSINLTNLNITRTTLIKDKTNLRHEITLHNLRQIEILDHRQAEVDGQIQALRNLHFCAI